MTQFLEMNLPAIAIDSFFAGPLFHLFPRTQNGVASYAIVHHEKKDHQQCIVYFLCMILMQNLYLWDHIKSHWDFVVHQTSNF